MAKANIKQSSEFTFPELKAAERNIRYIPPEQRIIRGMKDAEEAFGKERMKNPKFKRELRRFQEKYSFKGLA